MKYTEESFKKEVEQIHGNLFEVVGRFKGISKPLLISDKYGLMEIKQARQLLASTPGIKAALNQTEYFMNMVKEKYPEIYEKIEPVSEYKGMNTKMLFKDRYGVMSTYPSNIILGHCPNIKSAIDRKAYFKNQLLFLYDNKYDFEVDSTDRHKGRVTLICPIHGKQSIDSDSIFLGSGCPKCNHCWEKSDLFYLVRLYTENESFYKLGISHKTSKGTIRRFKEYRTLGYQIEEIVTILFQDFLECRELETKLKRLIKNNLYKPNNWDYNTSTECFSNELLPTILENLKYDIVSTSDENQSSESGKELTTLSEDI